MSQSRIQLDNKKEQSSANTNPSPWAARQSLMLTQKLYPYVKPLLTRFFPNPKQDWPEYTYLSCEDAYLGKFADLFRKDGRGLDRNILEGGLHAAKTPAGIAAWPYGSTTFKLITQPDDIQKVLKENLPKICMHDSTGSFKLFFGEQTIFNTPHGSMQWQTLRRRFLMFLHTSRTLKNDIPIMQTIIDKHLARIENNAGVISDLETFANSVTIDMIGGTKLGLKEIAEDTKKAISQIISDAVIEVANPFDQLMSEYIPGYKYLVDKKFFYTYVTGSKLHPLVSAGHHIIRDELIKPNEANIKSSFNWLYPPVAEDEKPSSFWDRCRSNEKFNIYGKQTIQEIAQFLVVGQETTAKLFLTSTLLLADSKHANILDKVRAEIAAQSIAPEDWMGDSMPSLPYLDAILSEALRLYPPIPDMLFKVLDDFDVNGNHFHKGNYIVISQRHTHQLKSVWGEDAHEFNPERFLNKNKKYGPHQFFPFGFIPRECAGQLFSRQEVKLWLARLVNRFDLKCEVQHPFPFHQIFTMRIDLKNIHLTCTPRLDAENTLRMRR